jgi:hypothetical protein
MNSKFWWKLFIWWLTVVTSVLVWLKIMISSVVNDIVCFKPVFNDQLLRILKIKLSCCARLGENSWPCLWRVYKIGCCTENTSMRWLIWLIVSCWLLFLCSQNVVLLMISCMGRFTGVCDVKSDESVFFIDVKLILMPVQQNSWWHVCTVGLYCVYSRAVLCVQ